jgi:tRNA pseudouridine38-40 synthase
MKPESKRFLAIVAFKGTRFQGWQTQRQGQSVQEHLEKAWSQILNQPIRVYGSSRTDAGVHARGMVCHFDAITKMLVADLWHRVNRLLPHDIVVRKLKRVPTTFESRFSYSRKIYDYQVLTGIRQPFLHDTTYYFPHDCSFKKVQEAQRLFLGKHRFYTFTTKKEDQADFYRTLYQVKVVKKGPLLTFTFIGDGFMTYMVRMIMGTILAYAQDKLTLAEIRAYLDNKVNSRVNFKVPPEGLCLEKVIYETATT